MKSLSLPKHSAHPSRCRGSATEFCRHRESTPQASNIAYLSALERRLTEDSHLVYIEDTCLGSGSIDDLTSLKQIVDLLRAATLGTA